jgi:hypothetical protein
VHVLLRYIITETNKEMVGRLGRSSRRVDNANGFALATSTFNRVSGMVMEETYLGLGLRSKELSMVGD